MLGGRQPSKLPKECATYIATWRQPPLKAASQASRALHRAHITPFVGVRAVVVHGGSAVTSRTLIIPIEPRKPDR